MKWNIPRYAVYDITTHVEKWETQMEIDVSDV